VRGTPFAVPLWSVAKWPLEEVLLTSLEATSNLSGGNLKGLQVGVGDYKSPSTLESRGRI
jgi:hypothetical protein